MVFVILFVAVSISFLTNRKTGHISNPITLFNMFWCILSFFAYLRLYGMIETSEIVFFIVLLGIIFFDIGAAFFMHIKTSDQEVYKINYKMIYVLFSIGCLFSVPPAISSLFLLRSGRTLWEIRYLLSNSVFKSGYAGFKFFSLPIAAAFPVIFFTSSYFSRKVNKKILIPALVLFVLAFIAEGGRSLLLIWIVSGSFFVFKRTEKVDKKIKRRIVLLLLGAFFAFWWIFRIRGTTNILKSIYFYFCGGLAFFSKHYIDYKENFNETIFWGTYQGLLRPIIGVLEVLGIQAPKLFDEATSFLLYCQKNPIRIASDGSTQNYFTTCFAYYYLDGRIIGVCMHSLIYGTLCGYCYKLQKKNKDERSTSIYIFIVIGIVLGIISSCLAEVTYSWGLVFMILCYSKNRRTGIIDIS